MSTHAKSVAMMPFAWVRMNCAQVGPVRPGAGSIPAARRIVQTVDAAIRWPSRHELAVDAPVTPRWVLVGEADREAADLRECWRSPRLVVGG